jgi:two-component system nitrate/nitrite response regulator NarL
MEGDPLDGGKKGKNKVVLIASPSPRLLRFSVQPFRQDFDTRGAADWAVLKEMVASLKPSLLFLDLTLPRLGGVRALSMIRHLSPSTKTVLLTDTPDEAEAVIALKAGARGYCQANISRLLLRKAADLVEQGEIWVGHSVVRLLLEELGLLSEWNGPVPDRSEIHFELLSPRENQIACLIGNGQSNKEIAFRLNISRRTVKAHLSSIFQKLNVSNRLQLALSVAEKSRS